VFHDMEGEMWVDANRSDWLPLVVISPGREIRPRPARPRPARAPGQREATLKSGKQKLSLAIGPN